MFEGLRKPKALIVIVVTFLAYGCPIQAIVQAFGLDERTVVSPARSSRKALPTSPSGRAHELRNEVVEELASDLESESYAQLGAAYLRDGSNRGRESETSSS